MQSPRCQFPGCVREVYPGGKYCSKSHRDQSPLCQYPGCTRPCYPGSAFCSRSHRNNAPHVAAASGVRPDPTASVARSPANSARDNTLPARMPDPTGADTARRNSPTESYVAQSDAVAPAVGGVIGILQTAWGFVVDLFFGSNQPINDDPARNPAQEPRLSSNSPGPADPAQGRIGPHKEILFYDKNKPYYEFTNFAPYAVRHKGKMYPTSEHLFQSMKFTDERDSELIRSQPTPRDAFSMAQSMRHKVRKGWLDQKLNIKYMELAVELKFTQHEELKRMLLNTGEAMLVEDSPIDPFWGIGLDGKGKNKLGEILMNLRSQLRDRRRPTL